MIETKPLTKKQYEFVANKILEEAWDFKNLYFLTKRQIIKELKRNQRKAREELQFYKTVIKRINYYIVNGKKYYTITQNDKAGTEVIYYKGKKIGEFD